MEPSEKLAKLRAASSTQSGKRFDRIEKLLYEVLDEDIPGSIVELGTYEGYTACFIQVIMVDRDRSDAIHIFDSFEGLPERGDHDGPPVRWLMQGHFSKSMSDVRSVFTQYGMPQPVLHPGWFSDTMGELPSPLAFAHLDADLYESTRDALPHVYANMSPGGIIVLDDYYLPRTPGVKIAVDEFLADKVEQAAGLGTVQAFIRKA